MEPKRFSDFADEKHPLEGSKMRIFDILDREILVTAFEIRKSKFEKEERDKVMMLQFEMNDEKHILFTASEVLMRQVQKYDENIPFLTKITQIHRCFSFA